MPDHQPARPQRLLIARRSSLGDIVCTMPTLVALRRGFPDAHIAWLVDHRFREILEGHECLDEVIPIRRHSARKLLPLIAEVRRVKKLLRARQFDMALDVQGLLKSSLLCYLSGAPRRLGFDDDRRELCRAWINERCPADRDRHAVDRYLLMAEYLGCPTEPVEFRLPIAEASRRWVEEFIEGSAIASDRPLVAFNVGATSPHKQWPPEHFARLAQLVYNKLEATVLLIGDSADQTAAESVKQQTTVPVVDAVGRTTLPQLPALIARCDVIVTGDTGPMHIAVAVGTPVVALIGPTLPHRTGPWGDNNIVLWSKPECACLNRPACRHYRCMYEISPESACDAVQQLLPSDG